VALLMGRLVPVLVAVALLVVLVRLVSVAPLVAVALLVVPVHPVSAVARLRVWARRRHLGYRVVTGICRIRLLLARRAVIHWVGSVGLFEIRSWNLTRCLIRERDSLSFPMRVSSVVQGVALVVVDGQPLFRL